MYDVTAWNLTMMFGLEALTLASDLPPDVVRPADSAEVQDATGKHHNRAQSPQKSKKIETVAVAINGADDRSVAVAARLLEQGLQVRVADRDFTINDQAFVRGSVLVTRVDNPRPITDLLEKVQSTAQELDLKVWPLTSGLGEDDLPDLGGRHFRRLEPPRIAVLSRGGTSTSDFGAIWHVLDRLLGIRHSHLNEDRLGGTDLGRYNLLVVPDHYWGASPVASQEKVRQWVESGGTLIAIGRSAGSVARAGSQLSRVRQLPAVLDSLENFQRAILKEWLAQTDQIPPIEEIWSHTAPPTLDIPWPPEKKQPQPKRSPRDLKKRDEWLRLFMPQGTLLATRVDTKHWLTYGCGDHLPVLFGSAVGGTPLLMAAEGVRAPVRFGYFESSGVRGRGESSKGANPQEKEGTTGEFHYIGWSPVPEGHTVCLRLSGLLWPEAAHRLTSVAYVTQERRGKGQVILFACRPAFRGGTLGTLRILTNALVYGPGLGARHSIEP
jgi:hypothetical protein